MRMRPLSPMALPAARRERARARLAAAPARAASEDAATKSVGLSRA